MSGPFKTFQPSALQIDLRDYFAAQALQGICAHDDTWGESIGGIAKSAYILADAMIAERAK